MTEKVKGSDKPWLDHYKLGPYPLRKTLEPYPRIPMYQFLDESAEAYPNQVAIEYLGNRIRYSELRTLVDRFANALVSLGVKKGDKVATVLPNCPQFIIADYATLKTGAALVPCSHLHRVRDLEYEIGESGAETVVCSTKALSRVLSAKEKTKLKNVIVTSPLEYARRHAEPKASHGAHLFQELLAEHEPKAPQVDIDPEEDLAYLSFTGGATGLPKGVMTTHFNRACNVKQFMWILEPLWPGVKGKAATEIVIPIFHSWGHIGVQSAIALGMRILLVSDPRDIRQAIDLMKEHRPLLVNVVPTHLMRIAEKQVGRLPVMFLSGAAPLPRETFAAIKRDIMMPVTEGYGLTECGPITHANISCFSKITGFVAKEKLGIGVPIPDTESKIIDLETGEELGAGEVGEIVLRAPQLMKGYWPVPGSGLDDGWLHTGDVGKMDEDGYFILEDRIKDMANISGYKVYTIEVDEVLFRCPGVAMAAAVGIPDPERPGSERIKAFIIPKEEYKEKLTAEQVIAFCKDELPPTAVPRSVEFTDELPLTVTDKIFKRALREEEVKKMRSQGLI